MDKSKVVLSLALVSGGVMLSSMESYGMVKDVKGKTYSTYLKEFKSIKSNLTSLKSSENLGDFDLGGRSIKLPIHTLKTDEGIDQDYVIHNGKSHLVFKNLDGKYVRALTEREIGDLVENRDNIVSPVEDSLGRIRLASVVNGDSGYIGVELDGGTWRYVREDSNRALHFGHKVDMDKLSISTKNTIRQAMGDLFRNTNKVFEDVK